MKINTQDLYGAALDWAVAKIEYGDDWGDYMRIINVTEFDDRGHIFKPSIHWETGGPIIERECIALTTIDCAPNWVATRIEASLAVSEEVGPTPLIAAMRCYVASQLGDEVEVPDELRN